MCVPTGSTTIPRGAGVGSSPSPPSWSRCSPQACSSGRRKAQSTCTLTYSTTVSVPSSELGPSSLPPQASVSLPRNQKGTGTQLPTGEGVVGSHFGRLEKKHFILWGGVAFQLFRKSRVLQHNCAFYSGCERFIYSQDRSDYLASAK